MFLLHLICSLALFAGVGKVTLPPKTAFPVKEDGSKSHDYKGVTPFKLKALAFISHLWLGLVMNNMFTIFFLV